eukprot:Rmarinus@m.3734
MSSFFYDCLPTLTRTLCCIILIEPTTHFLWCRTYFFLLCYVILCYFIYFVCTRYSAKHTSPTKIRNANLATSSYVSLLVSVEFLFFFFSFLFYYYYYSVLASRVERALLWETPRT